MQLGFNENVIYKGVCYHIQTEDGGIKNPIITTLLFKDGVVLASKRTAYADIIKSDKLSIVVRDIMKEQQENMLKSLKQGVFEEVEKKITLPNSHLDMGGIRRADEEEQMI